MMNQDDFDHIRELFASQNGDRIKGIVNMPFPKDIEGIRIIRKKKLMLRYGVAYVTESEHRIYVDFLHRYND